MQTVLQTQGLNVCLMCALYTAAVPRFLEEARSWGLDRDATVLLQKSPTLLQVRLVRVRSGAPAELQAAATSSHLWLSLLQQGRAQPPTARHSTATMLLLQQPCPQRCCTLSVKAPNGRSVLVQCADFSTHTARVAALRRLHPELDVGRVLWGQPGILKVPALAHVKPCTLSSHWARSPARHMVVSDMT